MSWTADSTQPDRQDDPGTDLEFGRTGRQRDRRSTDGRWRSPRCIVWAGVLGTALAVAAVALVNMDDSTTKSEAPLSTNVAAPQTTNAAAARTTNAAAAAVLRTVGPLRENRNGWGLFVLHQHSVGPSTIGRIDMATGDLTETDGSFNSRTNLLYGSGAHALVLSDSDLESATQAVPGPDGTIWTVDEDLSSRGAPQVMRLLRPHPGAAVTALTSYDISSLGMVYLAGSTAAGDPIYAAQDGTYFSFHANDGTSTRLSGSGGMYFDHGNIAMVKCDVGANCSIVLRGGQFERTIPYSRSTRVSISPDGAHALVWGAVEDPDFCHMLDLRTGSDTATAVRYTTAMNSTAATAWTPDSSVVVVLHEKVTGTGIEMLSVVRNDGSSDVETTMPIGASPSEDALIGIA